MNSIMKHTFGDALGNGTNTGIYRLFGFAVSDYLKKFNVTIDECKDKKIFGFIVDNFGNECDIKAEENSTKRMLDLCLEANIDMIVVGFLDDIVDENYYDIISNWLYVNEESYVELESCYEDRVVIIKKVESDNFTFDEYKRLAMRTAAIPEEDKESRLTHAALGLASEAGEVAGLLQKEFQGHERDKNHIKKELGDCLWMIAEACDALGISMTEVAITNIIKLKTRFPEGFSEERSLNRDKDDI